MKPVRQMLQALALSDEPEVIRAQYREIERQVPALYALLIVNTGAVAFTHRHLAPTFLTSIMPVALCLVCVLRVVKWARARGREKNVNAIRAQLRRSIVFAGIFGLTAVLWSLTLAHYGGPYEQGHVALYISITVIACIFCLMYLPQAALLGCLLVTGPYVTFYFLQRSPVWTAIALNIALVSLVMIRVLLNSFKGFVDLVRSQRDMATKSAEAERLSEENAQLALTDSLTGLPNRRFFFSRLEEAIEHAGERFERFAVGVLDLDRFKPVNDTYGHIFGDRLLAEVGRRLASGAGDEMILTRLGGDEFGVILFGDCTDVASTGKKLCDLVAGPYRIDDVRVTIGCSAGFAIFPEAGLTAHALFDRSDYALYHVKSQERGHCVVFSVDHETAIRSERAIETALQSAHLASEMTLHLQPIGDLKTGRTVMVEALARWNNAELGNVPPDRFISLAERSGMIHKVTRILFHKALDILAELPGDMRLSFNLSAHDIVSNEMVDLLLGEIRRRRIAPGRLVFELTETALMHDLDLAIAGAQDIRKSGCAIALDDFGTGYSSLSYLRRLPIDKVKVDRSFVTSDDAQCDVGVLAAIKGLCDNLGLSCLVEGIETEDQLRAVQRLGYDEAQGYLMGRPMPLAQFQQWYDRQERDALQLAGTAKAMA